MDILKRLSGFTDGMSNADVYKLVRDEIESLRAQLAAQPTPSQNEEELLVDAINCADGVNEQGLVFEDTGLIKLYVKWQARAQLSSPQPTPSQSEPVEWNFEYDQLTEEFIHELDDKTAITIIGFNRGYWAQHFNSKPQPTSQGEAVAIMEVISTVSKHLATTTPVYKQLKMLVSYDKIPVGARFYTMPQPTSQDAERLKCLYNHYCAIKQIANTTYEQWVANIDAMKESK